MQKWLDDKDNLRHLTHNDGNSVLVRTLKVKICKKMTTNIILVIGIN